MKAIAAALLALLAGACAAPHPDARVTPLATPALGLSATTAPAIAADWWTAFADPQLNRIMADALAGNPTLDSALARVRQAAGIVDQARAGRRPQVAIDGSEQIQRLSKVYMIPPPYGGSTMWVGDLQGNFSLALDFWGRQADLVRQAAADEGSARLELAAARLALSGSIAETYANLGRAEQQIALLGSLLRGRQASLALTKVRVASQLASDMDIRAGETLVAEAEQAVVEASQQRSLAVHALALLAGKGASYYDGIGPVRAEFGASFDLPAELPADLLARRPDIGSALARIDAARAGERAAAKAYYPNVNLSALAGLQALGLGKLLSIDAATAGAGAAIHLPLFEGGQLRARHESAAADLDSALANYNSRVLAAVQESADALTRIASLGEALAAQRRTTAGLTDLKRLNEVRVEHGLGSRLDLIGADLNLLSAEQQGINLTADRTIARIQLLVALGGGFDPAAATVTADASSTALSAAPSAQGTNQ